MDFPAEILLKEDYTLFISDQDGNIRDNQMGLYCRDTRFLKRYSWKFDRPSQLLMRHITGSRGFHMHHGLMEGEVQLIGIRRQFKVLANGFEDLLTVENTSSERQRCILRLETAADCADIFSVRGLYHHEHPDLKAESSAKGLRFRHEAGDGIVSEVYISFDPAPDLIGDGLVQFAIDTEPRSDFSIRCTVSIETPGLGGRPAITYRDWRGRFDLAAEGGDAHIEEDIHIEGGAHLEGDGGTRGVPIKRAAKNRAVIEQAVDDLRALLLFTEEGPVPAGGIPWYGAAFGRDSLLTAYMLLPQVPDLAAGVLRYLAARQGRRMDPFRAEEPGKIMHEIRFGELSRTGVFPYHPFYGSVDATPLFIMLLHELWRVTGDSAIVCELQSSWEQALYWLETYGDIDGDDFLEYESFRDMQGLTVQSWKDSSDSMSHTDGSLAQGAIAPSEVQGYAYAAYKAAADFYRLLGQEERAGYWRSKAGELKARFDEHFWLPDLKTYALALDGKKRPLRILNSNAGHLLFTGIASEEILPDLVQTLFSAGLWSGWGIRTIGSGEERYNPVSYHNGSVWPHDTALIAGGLHVCGYRAEAELLRDALFDLAESQPDRRLPELVAGYPRIPGLPPIGYPGACRPQAWDAAAIIYLSHMSVQ